MTFFVTFFVSYHGGLVFFYSFYLSIDSDVIVFCCVSVGRAVNMYTGAAMTNYRTQVIFNHTEDFSE